MNRKIGVLVGRRRFSTRALFTEHPALSCVGITILACTLGLIAPGPHTRIEALTAGAQAADLAPVVSGHVLSKRWVYLPANFQVSSTVDRLKGILDRAKAAGYNGALVTDSKFGRLEDGSLIEAYYPQLQEVLEYADDLGMQMIPAATAFGYSEQILWHDPNLAEAMPVRGASFRAESGALVPYEAEPVRIVNGDFEAQPPIGHAFPGWAWQDVPGTSTFVDRAVKRSGAASLRMDDLGTTNPPHGNGRIHQSFTVEPFHNYHVQVWVRTEGFRGGDVRVLVLGQAPGRTLQWNSVPVSPDQDWTRFDTTFNSLSHDEALFYLGVWGGDEGSIWWDDASIEPAGLVNLVRRPGTPVRIVSNDGSTEYQEELDVDVLVDPLMGSVPWPGSFDAWHEPPVISLAVGSRIADGQIVKIDYYQTTTIYGEQVTASLTEPRALEIATEQLHAIKRAFDRAGLFSGWFFSHDEIRMGGWDDAPSPGDGSPGARLAFNVATLHSEARDAAPDAELYIWSDMFDPSHNAEERDEPYYLVNGDWSGSWEGLTPDVTVMNWNRGSGTRRASAEFFAGRGHAQMLAGYYDGSPDEWIDREWLEDLSGIPEIEGVLYAQWGSGYDQLEAWAEYIWGDAEWIDIGAPPTDTATAPTAEPTLSSTGTASAPTAESTPPPTGIVPTTPTKIWLPVVHRGRAEAVQHRSTPLDPRLKQASHLL